MIFIILSLDFFLLSPCTTEQWLAYIWWYAYHSVRNPGLRHILFKVFPTVFNILLCNFKHKAALRSRSVSALKMEALYFTEVLVGLCTHKSTLRYSIEDHHQQLCHRENLMSHMICSYVCFHICASAWNLSFFYSADMNCGPWMSANMRYGKGYFSSLVRW
jgi:hypothetical protein